MKRLHDLPPVPFTVRLHNLRHLERLNLNPYQLYTVIQVLEVNELVIGYRLLEVPLAEDEVLHPSRFYIYATNSPN